MENEGKDSLGTTNDAAGAPIAPRQIFSSPDLAAPTVANAPLPTDPLHPVRSVGSGQGDVMLSGVKVPFNKKFVFLALGGVALAGIIIFAAVSLFSRGRATDPIATIGEMNTTLIFDQTAPIRINLDGNYGYLNPEDGSTLIDPRFIEAERFYGDYALAKTGSEDVVSETLVINRTGATVFSFEGDNVETYYDLENNYWLIDGDLYDAQMKKFSPENTISHYIGNGFVLVKTAIDPATQKSTQKNSQTTTNNATPANNSTSASENGGGSSADDAPTPARLEIGDEIAFIGPSYIANLDGKKIYDCGENCSAFTVKADGVVYAVTRVPGESSRIVNLSDTSVIYSAQGAISLRDGGLVERQNGKNSKYLRIQSNQVVTLASQEIISSATLSNSDEFMIETCKTSSKNSKTKYSLKTTSGETLLDCNIDEYYELSPSLYVAFRKKFNKSPVLILRDGSLQLFDMKQNQIITAYEAQAAMVFDNSPFAQIINLENGKEQVCDILASEKGNCFALKEENHSVEGYGNYFIVDNTNEQHFYNATLKEIR